MYHFYYFLYLAENPGGNSQRPGNQKMCFLWCALLEYPLVVPIKCVLLVSLKGLPFVVSLWVCPYGGIFVYVHCCSLLVCYFCLQFWCALLIYLLVELFQFMTSNLVCFFGVHFDVTCNFPFCCALLVCYFCLFVFWWFHCIEGCNVPFSLPFYERVKCLSMVFL